MLSVLLSLAAAASTIVIGHKSPDTDAVCAALAYAWELNERGIPAEAFRQGDLNPETEFVLQKLGVAVPKLLPALAAGAQVAIVDTNNPAELPEDLSKAKIHSIVDHHKMSGLTNAEPIEVDMRPLCSAGSILYARAKAAKRTVPKQIAGLMLSSLLSDSLGFRSPTTTKEDEAYAKELAKLAGLDATTYGDAMLDAKAKIDHLSPEELVFMDSKIFTLGGKKLRVSVLETTQPAEPLKKTAAIVAAQKAVGAKEGTDVLFFVVDILKKEAVYLSSSESGSKLVQRAFGATVSNGRATLPGVLSRKKQIIPKLEKAATEIQKEEL